MAGEYAISLVNVTKQHGAKTVLEDVNLSFFQWREMPSRKRDYRFTYSCRCRF